MAGRQDNRGLGVIDGLADIFQTAGDTVSSAVDFQPNVQRVVGSGWTLYKKLIANVAELAAENTASPSEKTTNSRLVNDVVKSAGVSSAVFPTEQANIEAQVAAVAAQKAAVAAELRNRARPAPVISEPAPDMNNKPRFTPPTPRPF